MATTVNKPVPGAGSAAAHRPVDYAWAIARISIGWIFLWAFLDKAFGWGFATPANKAWIAGGSPTTGFLKGSGENALGGFFSSLAGQAWVDWLFMLGLLGIGTALVLGIGTCIAAPPARSCWSSCGPPNFRSPTTPSWMTTSSTPSS